MRRTAPLLLLALAACSSGSGGTLVAITASDSQCAVAKTDLAAGDTTFRVTNKGSDVTEVYVYDGDRVVTEKENIGPGTSATFTADLAAGDYQVACKPGQQGDGIRTDIHVTGAGGATQAVPDDEVEFDAKEYAFVGNALHALAPKTGESVKFELKNKGTMPHEFEVLGPDGKSVGEIAPTDAGDDGEVVLTFATAGTYTYQCGIDGHAAKGMKGTFTVS